MCASSPRHRNENDSVPDERAKAGNTHFFRALRLYVAGTTRRSVSAIAKVRKLCDEHFPGHYGLEIVDILQRPSRAERDHIVAAPMLIQARPVPARRVAGDMSQTDRILSGLGQRRGADTDASHA